MIRIRLIRNDTAKRSDEELVDAILNGNERERNGVIKLLYNGCYGYIERLVVKYGGAVKDAEDVFQEGLMVLYMNLKNEKFQYKSSLNTYLKAICKNIFHSSQNTKKELLELDEIEDTIETYSIDYSKMNELLEKVDESCQRILKLFYLEDQSMTELKNEFNLSSTQAAKNKKLRCLKKLMALVKEKNMSPDQFILE